jgi:hypothetical protein
MRALIVCESMFGNTRRIGEAVGESLDAYTKVDLVDVAAAPLTVPPEVELLVVGAPTHAFGLSRPGTRRSAEGQGAAVDPTVGLRDWLTQVKEVPAGLCAAAFDTRIRRPRLPGSAARAANRRLKRLGLRPVAHPESFWVTATAGPLLPGEVERALRWGHELGAMIRAKRGDEEREARR